MPYGSMKAKIEAELYLKNRNILKNNVFNGNNSDIEYVEYNGKNIIVMICSKCNIKCEHCYISYSGNRDPDELLKLVRELKKKYIIELNGAEVLTNLEYLKSYKENNQKYIISNGKAILNNPNTITALKENNISTVAMSYHFGIHDQVSMIPEEDLLKVMKLLKENNIEYRLMTTINSNNYLKIMEMCDNAYSLGARAIKFTNYIYQGNAMNLSSKNILTDDQKKQFFDQLAKARKKYNKDELIIERCGTFGRNNLNKDNFYCDCITDSVVLTPYNRVYPCVFLAAPGYEIGEYRDGKILIYNNLINNHKACFADKICNQPKRLVRGLER